MQLELVIQLFCLALAFYAPAQLLRVWFECYLYPSRNRIPVQTVPRKYYVQTFVMLLVAFIGHQVASSISIEIIVVGLLLLCSGLLVALFVQFQSLMLSSRKKLKQVDQMQMTDLSKDYQFIRGLY